MKHRNPLAVFILSIITLGIYDIYWLVTTKKELNQKTHIHTPTIWLLFAPVLAWIAAMILIVSQSATGTNNSAISIFILLVYLIGFVVILPISFYWFFKFSKAVNEYTSGKMSTGVTFLLLWLLHLLGVAIVQDAFNDMNGTPGAVTNGGAKLVAGANQAPSSPSATPPLQSPVPPATVVSPSVMPSASSVPAVEPSEAESQPPASPTGA